MQNKHKKKQAGKFTSVREVLKRCGGKDVPKALRVTMDGLYKLAIENRIDLYFACPSIPMTDGAYFIEDGDWRSYPYISECGMRSEGFRPLYSDDIMTLRTHKVCTVSKCKNEDMTNSINVSFFDNNADAIQLKFDDVYLHEDDIQRIVTGEIYKPPKPAKLASQRPSHRKAIEHFTKQYLQKHPLALPFDDLPYEKREEIYKGIEGMIHAAPEVYKLHVIGKKKDLAQYRTIKRHARPYIIDNQ